MQGFEAGISVSRSVSEHEDQTAVLLRDTLMPASHDTVGSCSLLQCSEYSSFIRKISQDLADDVQVWNGRIESLGAEICVAADAHQSFGLIASD